ncbi:MAG TPA: GntR family transcriptional regulator [Longimicrobiales bacterium]|nr:GntR family transcriptional regulator [Longimicrobiales bacterium]
MSRAQPGAVILDQLRDRIVTGLYFGNWQPGERLPSIRDIADAEAVDRKTAAAAYHRLAEEGLVEVKARSGVFLRDEHSNGGLSRSGPLERLQRRWLKNTCEGARALGLDTHTVLRLFNAVADVETSPIPVIEDDEATARTIAQELHDCVGIDARPVRVQDALARPGAFAAAPFVVTTPYHAAQVSIHLRQSTITATLSLELLHGLLERATSGQILVVVPSDWIAQRVEAALRQRAPNVERTRVVVAGAGTDLLRLRREASSVFVWPGCDDVLAAFEGDDCVKPVRLLSEVTIDRVRTAVLDTALRQVAGPAVNSSNGGGTPPAVVVLDR